MNLKIGKRKIHKAHAINQTIFIVWLKIHIIFKRQKIIQHFGLKTVSPAWLISTFPPQGHHPGHSSMACSVFLFFFFLDLTLHSLPSVSFCFLSLTSIFNSLMTLDTLTIGYFHHHTDLDKRGYYTSMEIQRTWDSIWILGVIFHAQADLCSFKYTIIFVVVFSFQC